MGDEVDFLPADKCQKFLQIDIVKIFQACFIGDFRNA